MSTPRWLHGRAVPLALGLALLGGACRPQTPATGAPAPRPGGQPGAPTPGGPGNQGPVAGGLPGAGGPGGAQEPNPRPYAQVVTSQARTSKGMITAHFQRGRLLFEIPAAELGKDMLIVSSLRGTARPLPVIGTLGDERLVRWERRDNRVLLRAVSHANVSTDTTTPFNRAVDIVRFAPIMAAFNVEAFGPDSAPVIDVTRLFVGGVTELAALGQRATVDQSRSFVERATAYDQNVAVVASQTFTLQPTPGQAPNPFAGPPTATTELYHFSMVKLPEQPMMPRLHDDRMGFFSITQLDWGSTEQRVARRRLVTRWRLECSEERVGDLCVPRKPITYHVDPNTPPWLVPFVKAGIEEWQPAFEAAGFHRGIVAAEVAPGSDVEGEDATVAMVRWVPSSVANAVGPSTVDPRTGEILDADVQMLHNIMDLQLRWYFTQVGHLDPRVHRLPMPDSLMGRLVQFVVAHEVGHTLGYPHNMKGSSMYPLDSIRSRSWVARMGHSPSIMDYARFNYVAQPEDSLPLGDLVPRVGPYDVFVTRWGYAPVPGAATPEAEKPTLNRLAGMQDTIPWFRFTADEGLFGPDPGESREAVGDADAVRATELGLRNIRRIVPLLEPAAAWREGDRLEDLAQLYGALVGQWAMELSHVARIPGGVYHQHKVIGQAGPVWEPLPAARQREAIAFLNEHAFSTPDYLLVPSLLRRVEAAGSVDRIGNAQRNVLNTLLANDRLQRMVEIEALAGNGGLPQGERAYTVGAMLGELRRGIFREAYRGAPIDAYRRRLQRSYIEVIGTKVNPPPAPSNLPPGAFVVGGGSVADARALLRGELVELDRELAAAVRRTSDRTSRLHLEDARYQISRILDPE